MFRLVFALCVPLQLPALKTVRTRTIRSTDDPCPHLEAMGRNSRFPGLEVPYRLADVGPRGVGIFALRDIKKGEVVVRFYPQSHIFLTKSNWKEAVANQTLLHHENWKDDRHISEALKAVQEAAGSSDLEDIMASQDDGTVEALHELFRRYLGHNWWYSSRYFNPDDPESVAARNSGDKLPVQVVLELDDGRYMNHAPTHRPRRGTGKGESLASLSRNLKSNVHKVNKSDDEVASKDIEACTELRVDYWESDFEYRPDWVEGMLRELNFEEFGDKDNKFRFTGNALPNIVTATSLLP